MRKILIYYFKRKLKHHLEEKARIELELNHCIELIPLFDSDYQNHINEIEVCKAELKNLNYEL